MDRDLDKEIEVLLRSEGGSRPARKVDPASGHLDTDELSVFAEGALPEKIRRPYTLHLAECDRCRKTLSDLILLNTADEPAAAETVAPQASLAPDSWYRRLMIAPSLAYVMGVLVVLFTGFLGYTLLRPSGPAGTEVSQISEANRTAGGPSAGENQTLLPTASTNTTANVNTSASAMNAAPSNANTVRSSTSFNSPAPPKPLPEQNAGAAASNTASAATTSDSLSGASSPSPAVSSKVEAERAKQDKDVTMGRRDSRPTFEMQKQTADAPTVMKSAPADDTPSAKMRSVVPLRDMKKLEERTTGTAANEAGAKRVAGKAFEFRQGVWYDTSYIGQKTTNVRRGSEQYKKLDASLRSTAESLGATSVIVWKGKAYRFN